MVPGKYSLFELSMVDDRLIASTTVMFAGFPMIHANPVANRAREMEGAPFAATQTVWGVQILISAVVRTLSLFLFPLIFH